MKRQSAMGPVVVERIDLEEKLLLQAKSSKSIHINLSVKHSEQL